MPDTKREIPESDYQILVKLAELENTSVGSFIHNMPQYINRTSNRQKEYEELIQAFNEVRNENMRLKNIIKQIYHITKNEVPPQER